ncbi:hypothetical protein OBBRIDRAFT_696880, partial [Obba rivulosa]
VMPSRNDPKAPRFDPTNPRTLRRYFEDLEMHFLRCNIVGNEDKKMYARLYTPIDVEDLWSILPSSAMGIPYQHFKEAVSALYPGSSDAQRFRVSDLDALLGERARIGIVSLDDFAKYHRDFTSIATWLIQQGKMSEKERDRLFMRGFPESLKNRILHRLQIIDPNHDPDDPYQLDDVAEQTKYVLHDTAA